MLQDVIEALRRNAPNAVALARAEVAAAPESADAYHLLGMAQREAGDRAGAGASFDHAIQLSPDESLYHFSRAMLAWSERDFATANRASAHALALDPNQLGAYVLRIQLALAAGDTAEAERQMHLAERAGSGQSQLLLAAGQIAQAKGEGDRAIALLNQAAVERPQDARVFETLGLAYLRFGHNAFAEQALRKAMTLDPSATGLRRALVESLLGQDRFDEAETELAAYRREHPRDAAAMVIDADMKWRARDAVAALALYRQALAQAPRAPRALAGARRALAAIGDRALSRSVWEEVLRRDAGFDPVWAARLDACEESADNDEVLRRWRAAMPDSVAAVLNQARKDDLEGRDAQAEAGYDAVLARVPHQAQALFGKAKFESQRDPAAAIGRMDVLIQHAVPSQAAPALAIRGLLHDRTDRTDAASADWRQAHAGRGELPKTAPLPLDVLRTLAALPMPAATDEDPLVLLWGPPGSGSERLAVALRLSAGRPLLQETQELLPRVVLTPDDLMARALDSEQMPAFAAEVAGEYSRMVAPLRQQGSQGVFDWRALWDARTVPMLRHALPSVRLIAVLRDPRDMLLNWLAFGAPVGPAFNEPVASAQWLAHQLEHLLASRDDLGLPVHIVDMDRFDANPDAQMQALSDFARLPVPPDAQPAIRRRVGTGRFPALLPAGRWHAYSDAFAEAFEVLAPLAERLGYPRAQALFSRAGQ